MLKVAAGAEGGRGSGAGWMGVGLLEVEGQVAGMGFGSASLLATPTCDTAGRHEQDLQRRLATNKRGGGRLAALVDALG